MKKLFIIPAIVLVLTLQNVNGQTNADGENPNGNNTNVKDKVENMQMVLDELQNEDSNSSFVIAPLAKLNDLVQKVIDLRTQLQNNNSTQPVEQLPVNGNSK